MTMTTAQIILTSSATLLCAPDDMSQRVTIHNNESAQQVFLGDSGVTILTGIHLDGKQERQITLNPGEGLWGIAAVSGSVGVMIQRM
jgi:uncharacterized protein YdgA (DUF945 family)